TSNCSWPGTLPYYCSVHEQNICNADQPKIDLTKVIFIMSIIISGVFLKQCVIVSPLLAAPVGLQPQIVFQLWIKQGVLQTRINFVIDRLFLLESVHYPESGLPVRPAYTSWGKKLCPVTSHICIGSISITASVYI